MKVVAEELKSRISKIQDNIKGLKLEIDHLYDEFNNHPYSLYGVFMHEGGANFGHYWNYLYDATRSRWIKYNDSKVSLASSGEVFMNTTGKTFNAFSLIYVETDKIQDLTSPYVRTREYRTKLSASKEKAPPFSQIKS